MLMMGVMFLLLRDIGYFTEIIRQQSFSKAAQTLYVSQPALSQAVSRLEEEFGQKLLHRNKGAIIPTEAGKILAEEGESMLRISERIHVKMSDILNLHTGRITVGISHLYGKYYFSHIMPTFINRYPEIKVHVVEDTSSKLEQLLEDGIIDLAFFSTPSSSKKQEQQYLFTEPLLFAVPPNHPINRRYPQDGLHLHTISLSLFKDDNFLMIKAGQRLHDIGYALCAKAGFIPQVVFESGNSELINTFIAKGLGVGFLPMAVRSTCLPEHRAVYYLLDDPDASRRYVVSYQKNRSLSLAAQRFIEVAQEISHQFGTVDIERIDQRI